MWWSWLTALIFLIVLIEVNRSNRLVSKNGANMPWKKGICLQEIQERPQEFKPKKFFRGRWYEGQRFGTFFNDVVRKCITIDAEMNNMNVNLTVYEYIPVIFSTVSQNVSFALTPDNTTSFQVIIPWLGLTGVELPVNIISTDYDDYAILYSCSPALGLPGYISEMGFIFRRNRGDLKRFKELREIVWRNGMKIEDFEEADNTECPQL